MLLPKTLFRQGLSIIKTCPFPILHQKLVFNLKDAFFVYDNVSDPKEIERLVAEGRESLLLLKDIFALPLEVQMDILGMQHMDSTAKESLAEMKDYVITKHASSQLKSDSDSHDRSLLLAKLRAKKLKYQLGNNEDNDLSDFDLIVKRKSKAEEKIRA